MENSSMQVQVGVLGQREREGEGAFYYVIRLSDTSSLTNTQKHRYWNLIFETELQDWQKTCRIWLVFLAWLPSYSIISSIYKPSGILAPGHFGIYSSSVSTTKTTVGPEPRPPAARSHTGMTTWTAALKVFEKTNFHVNCWGVVQGVLQGERPGQNFLFPFGFFPRRLVIILFCV